MCVAMVIIYKKTLEKKGVDDVTSKRLDLGPFQAQTMSQGTTLFSCGLMETSRWPEVRRGCGAMQQRPVMGASLESLWDVLPEVAHHQSPATPWGARGVETTTGGMVPAGAITSLLQDLSLAEAAAAAASPSTAPPSKRQCRSLSCSDELVHGCRSTWRPQGSRVWTAVEKRRCHSGGSVQRSGSGPPPVGFPAMQRSSSFSLPARSNTLELPCFGQRLPVFPASSAFTSLTASSMVSLIPSHEPHRPAALQTLYLSHEQICLAEPGGCGPSSPASSPDSTPELERRGGEQGGLARSRSQPCVLNDKKIGMKRRRPADTYKQRPSLDLAKMTQKLRNFHSLSCPGITGEEDSCQSSQQALPTLRSTAHCETTDFSSVSEHDQGPEEDVPSPSSTTKEEEGEEEVTGHATDPTIEELDDWGSSVGYGGGDTRVDQRKANREQPLWAGLCGTRKDMHQLGGELDIEQIERN